MDLRIIIVSWNVESLLERCLSSLPEACAGLDWEVVAIDNASKDRSVEVAKRFPFVRVVANRENRGFAKAVNQGLAGSDARYVLLLNPDTECPPESLTKLVRAAEAYPKAGIFGPALIYPDGRPQDSVRSFPTVWSQLGILLKLHHIVPRLKTFRRYFTPTVKDGRVDQVMGACFLIRREVIEQVGGLDERYFIWFEEVDYCREAVQRGWEVLYVPEVTVIHHGGQSFAKVFSLEKQRMFNRSLVSFFHKWHAGWRAWLIRGATPIAVAAAWAIEFLKRPEHRWVPWLLGLAFIEALSWSVIFNPFTRSMCALIMMTILFFLGWKRPALGLAVLGAELMIGSKGALFKYTLSNNPDAGVSVRILMSAAYLFGWWLNVLADAGTGRRLVELFKDLWKRKAWLGVFALCAWGVVRGVWLRNDRFFADANAWLDLALLLPVLDLARRDGARLIRLWSQVAVAALIWLPAKTLALLYVWSHGIKSLSQPFYLWVRRTGVGEVTLVTGNLFRVFIQSQVFALAAFVTASARTMEERGQKIFWLTWSVLTASAVSILISLSRSFWIGLFVGGLCLLVFAIRQWRGAIRLWIPAFARMILAVIAALGLIFATVAFPYPRVDVGSLKTLFGSRGSVGDAAAESRWNLLSVLTAKIKQAPILGSGFGASVTYQSKDPRILAQHPDGMYTTYVFEWGWLEHWIKFGILGIPLIAWLVFSLIRGIWKLEAPWWQRAGFVSSLVTLAALHVFTPYLNHPLGFGFLLAAEGWITAKRHLTQS